MYCFMPHLVPSICLNLAPISISALSPSGKLPTTRVRLLISFIMRSKGIIGPDFRALEGKDGIVGSYTRNRGAILAMVVER